MKSLFMMASLCTIACHSFAQWNPNNQTTGNIYHIVGNVGIGTTSPDSKLEVFGKSSTGMRIDGTNNDFEALSVYNTTASNLSSGNGAVIQFYNNAVNNNNGVFGASIKSVSVNDFYGWESDLYLRTTKNNSYTTQTIIDALVVKGGSGNVGFGTNSPTAKIETGSIPVNDPAFKTMDFQIVPSLGGGGWNGISQASDIGLIFKSGRSLVIAPHAPSISGLRITATGDVGIGASSPEGLQVNVPLSGETSKTEDNVRIGVLGDTPRIILDDAGYTPFQLDNAAGRFRIFTPGVEQFTVTANGNVGIGGVTFPAAKLDIVEPAQEAPAVRISNILIVPHLIGGSYNGISRNGDSGIILTNDQSFVIAPHKNETSGLRVNSNGNVGIGTNNPTQKLTVNGTVYSTEVKVDVNAGTGPDYVFEPTYQLPSLSEIENYIKANKHLPEVPSAKEMETNGVNLSEMNMLLLKKVEELTLHLIEATKKIEKQQMQIDNLNYMVYEKK